MWYAEEELSPADKEEIEFLNKFGDVRMRSLNSIAILYDKAMGELHKGATNIGHKGFRK